MRIALGLLLFLQLTSCAYKSIIMSPRKGSSTTINYTQPNIAVASTSNTILDDSISLAQFFVNKKQEKGSLDIFMSNSSLFIKARQVENDDSTTFNVTVYNKVKKDTIIYILKYSNYTFKDSVKINTDGSFIFNLSSNEQGKSSEADSFKFLFKKTKNFTIQDEIFELYTGEVTNPNLETFKYVIINDPEEKKLPPVCILTIVDTDILSKQCNTKYQAKYPCPKGQTYAATLHWSWKIIYKNITCDCQKIN